jgi:hypothetical protein
MINELQIDYKNGMWIADLDMGDESRHLNMPTFEDLFMAITEFESVKSANIQTLSFPDEDDVDICTVVNVVNYE